MKSYYFDIAPSLVENQCILVNDIVVMADKQEFEICNDNHGSLRTVTDTLL